MFKWCFWILCFANMDRNGIRKLHVCDFHGRFVAPYAPLTGFFVTSECPDPDACEMGIARGAFWEVQGWFNGSEQVHLRQCANCPVYISQYTCSHKIPQLAPHQQNSCNFDSMGTRWLKLYVATILPRHDCSHKPIMVRPSNTLWRKMRDQIPHILPYASSYHCSR